MKGPAGRWRQVLKGRVIVAIVVATAMAGAVYAAGALRQPIGPAAGLGPDAPGAGSHATDGRAPAIIRVATFNIRRGRGRDGKVDLRRTEACLGGFDVIGLNEVDGGWPFGLARDQATVLGERLGLASLFAPTERRFWHPHFGNGILSRLPILSWSRVPLTQHEAISRRNMLLVRLQADDHVLSIMITHVDSGPDRDRQLAVVLDAFSRLPEPAVLMGDFNARADHPALAEFLQRGAIIASNGAMPPAPEGIDWILARGIRPAGTNACDVGASDHPRVAVEFRWPEALIPSSPVGAAS